MNSKMFLIEKGRFVVVRDNSDNEISFGTMEEFKKFYPEIGTLIDGKYYVDYEPNRQCHHVAADDNGCLNIYDAVPFVQEYEDAITNVQLIISRKNDPYYGKTLEDAKDIALHNLKDQTRYQINQYLPDWKQLRWNNYVQIHEKSKKGQTLTALEDKMYQQLPEEGETKDECYENCLAGLEWSLDCITMHNLCEKLVKNAKTIAELKSIGPAYPYWPL